MLSRKKIKSIKSAVWLSLLAVSLVLGACASEVPETVQPIPTLPDFDHSAALEAQIYLAEQLGVEIDEVTIEDFQAENWPDACLGLPEEDEACASVITPGYQVTLSYEGQEYIVRTDETGTLVRPQTPADIEVESSY